MLAETYVPRTNRLMLSVHGTPPSASWDVDVRRSGAKWMYSVSWTSWNAPVRRAGMLKESLWTGRVSRRSPVRNILQQIRPNLKNYRQF